MSTKMLAKFRLLLQNMLKSSTEKEVLSTTQHYFRILGVNLVHAPQKYPLNLNNLRTFVVFGLGACSSFCFTCFSAKTFEEYIATFYILSSMLICFSSYTFLVWKGETLRRLFTAFRQNVHERKCAIKFIG